jgi:hypothetical protein
VTASELRGEPLDRSPRQDPIYWPLRYQLEMIGFTVDGLVYAAGGWLFDRAMAGWDVKVRVAGRCDLRPLRILGASVLLVDSTCESADEYPQARELAVAVEAVDRDAEVRAIVTAALNQGYPAVTLWGHQCSTALDHRFNRKRYRPSAAARAFKAQALGANLSAQDMAGADEIFATAPNDRHGSSANAG